MHWGPTLLWVEASLWILPLQSKGKPGGKIVTERHNLPSSLFLRQHDSALPLAQGWWKSPKRLSLKRAWQFFSEQDFRIHKIRSLPPSTSRTKKRWLLLALESQDICGTVGWIPLCLMRHPQNRQQSSYYGFFSPGDMFSDPRWRLYTWNGRCERSSTWETQQHKSQDGGTDWLS